MIDVLSLGISEDDYYSMTVKQLNNYVKAKQKAKETHLKEQAIMDYRQAYTIAVMVNMGLAGKSNFPTVEELYGLWTEDEIAEKNAIESADRFRQFANLYNSQFKAKKDGD